MRKTITFTIAVAVLSVLFPLASSPLAVAQSDQPAARPGDRMIADYFRQETKQLADRTFEGIETLEDWTSRKAEYRRQMLEMLSLDPMPEKTPLHPVVTGTLESSGVVAERLHFQSMPGLYVTANLYRPAKVDEPLPAILYVCGHGGERHEGKSLGNKTHYQHHGAWFAQNGYVCLTIDTVQLGEIEGIHHGTYREKMWWWNNRGYSSAGVEAFNCIRALDYLETRDEVDADRIGVTGRSGGGAYSWWIAAIDDRIQAAVPVAGITNLQNYVVDGCVEGHCDCMFMVNTYSWDFPMVAALVAPRPLLIANSDKDRIFPLDGVVDVYSKVRKIYALYDATDKLGLQISEGPHKDTQELRVAAFRWMNRFLKNDTELIETVARPLFEKRDLRVFDELPDDERASNIHESFVPKAQAGDLDVTSTAQVNALMENLRTRVFGGWPEKDEPFEFKIHSCADPDDKGARVVEFTSQSPIRLKMFVFERAAKTPAPLDVHVLDQAKWDESAPAFAAYFPDQAPGVEPDAKLAEQFSKLGPPMNRVFILPRGVGPTAWSDGERYQTHIRRRFMLLGQTLAGMQIYDVVRGIQAARKIPGLEVGKFNVCGHGDASFWMAYASLFSGDIDLLSFERGAENNRESPDLLNVSRFVELQDIYRLLEHQRTNQR